MASKQQQEGIPMKHPDGRDYTAESEVEAMTLMARGYTRTDGGTKSPRAGGAAAGSGSSPSSASSTSG